MIINNRRFILVDGATSRQTSISFGHDDQASGKDAACNLADACASDHYLGMDIIATAFPGVPPIQTTPEGCA